VKHPACWAPFALVGEGAAPAPQRRRRAPHRPGSRGCL